SSSLLLLLFFSRSGHHRDLHSFPTRRSSDLRTGPQVFWGLVVVGQHGLELDLLLLAGVDEQDLGADVVGEQLDHLVGERLGGGEDRKSTRLNSSHLVISYAVFCLKKKKQKNI